MTVVVLELGEQWFERIQIHTNPILNKVNKIGGFDEVSMLRDLEFQPYVFKLCDEVWNVVKAIYMEEQFAFQLNDQIDRTCHAAYQWIVIAPHKLIVEPEEAFNLDYRRLDNFMAINDK